MLSTSAAGVAGAALVASLLTAAPTLAAPPGTPAAVQGEVHVQGEDHGDRSVDNRRDRAERRTAAAAQLPEARTVPNEFGTLGQAADADGPLATGLSGDPETAAREYLRANADAIGIGVDDVDALELLRVIPAAGGSAVTLRQSFGDIETARDGLVIVGVRDGVVSSFSSTLAEDGPALAPAEIDAATAEDVAVADSGIPAEQVTVQRVREVALPLPTGGAARTFEVVLTGPADGEPTAFTTYVDAVTGDVLVRDDLVDFAQDNPEWDVFPANPPEDYSSADTRERWCWQLTAICDRSVGSPDSLVWDVDPATGQPTFTTKGNNAIAVEKRDSLSGFAVGTETATPRPDRVYAYPWTNQWNTERCNPATFTSPERADLDAARANLFVSHNRMHDWAYRLGFTEQAWNMQQDNRGRGQLGADYEQGNAQAGARVGGPPTFAARNNANQYTPPEGVAPVTNMYMWQPIPGSFYSPCVDGDYDMSVIGHEYTHAITNRMVAGPESGLSGPQAGAMGESWSDLFAMEYLSEYGFEPKGDTPYVTGGYVTGDDQAGIRNYDMSRSPLNYSNLGYDMVGTQVHADGEIWSATNFAVRQAFVDEYGRGNARQNLACAEGRQALDTCPGNRRWIQLHYDALLLSARGDLSMLDARDLLLAADRMRFGGANQSLLWNAFAARGMGDGAVSVTNRDADAIPSFASTYADNGEVVFRPTGTAAGRAVRLYIGDYEARAVPVADTDPATITTDRVRMVPGRYPAVAVGAGLGHQRLTIDVRPGRAVTVRPRMDFNLASATNGASVTGDGINTARLVDDTEATNWASIGGPVQGKEVTVDLAGQRQRIQRVQVSAALRPAVQGDPDAGTQNRFTALRSFEVQACDGTRRGVDCTQDAAYTTVMRSTDDAFPARAPRPRAPELSLRSFDLPNTVQATHLRVVVLDNQCTGNEQFRGDQDDDRRT